MEIRKLNHYSHCLQAQEFAVVDNSTKTLSMQSSQTIFWTHSGPQGLSYRPAMTDDEHYIKYFLPLASEASATISWQSLYTAFSLLWCSSLLFCLVFRVYQKELSICCGLDDKVSHELTYLIPWSCICGASCGQVLKFYSLTLLLVGSLCFLCSIDMWSANFLIQAPPAMPSLSLWTLPLEL